MPSIKEKELIAQACINLSGKLGESEISSAMSRNRILDSTISVADTTFGVIAKSVVFLKHYLRIYQKKQNRLPKGL